MPDSPDNDFLTQLSAIIEKNISNELFGVSELADEMNMSRSNLLRKVKKETKLSVSQLISQVRLKAAMEMLRKTSMNVSEVSHKVGFGSTSYFIKCFREYYGYPPGEVGKRVSVDADPQPVSQPVRNKSLRTLIFGFIGIIIASVAGYYMYNALPSVVAPALEKSIAVLPFKNESDDSTNVYLINGLMDATLINLQQIKDLKVISRTSAEKYRNSNLSIPEMAKELNVSYIVEGSGQKIGDKILLNIQLIDGAADKHLWANQYRRDDRDIFALQQEIARTIASEIQAVITPEEEKRIEKIPTSNLEAYNLFMKGREFMKDRGDMGKAIPYFKQAIELDPEFALAHAEITTAYFFADIYKSEKQYTSEIETHSDKAFLYDSKRAESLMAKAFYYVHKKEYPKAEEYLMKALEYNPNSSDVIGFLSDFYGLISPNTSKYLEYSLKGIQINVGSQDSMTKSYTLLRLANALAQSGFTDEALQYADESLEYNPKNPYSPWLRAFILYAKHGDLGRTRQLLIEEYKKDSSRIDILKDIGKTSYYLNDLEGAHRYYQQFLEVCERGQLNIYNHENLVIAKVLAKAGEKEKSEKLLKKFKDFIETDPSIYKHLGLTGYYSYLGDNQKALEHYRLFSEEENYQYWIILFNDKDPIVEPVVNLPEYKKISQKIETKFWKTHDELKQTLQEKGLL